MSDTAKPTTTRTAGAALTLLLCCASARTASSQARDPLAAEALFREGRKAVGSSDYANACPKFSESFRLDPAPGTLLNLADCEEHIGKIGGAWQHYHRLIDMLPARDERAAFAHKHAEALEKRVPRLTITLAPDPPDGTRVWRDDVELGAPTLAIALPVDPGTHVLTLKAPGHVDATVSVTLVEAESRQVSLTAGPSTAEGAGGATSPTAPSAAESPAQKLETAPGSELAGGSRTPSPAAWAIGATGVAALGTGVFLGVSALSKKSTSDSHCVSGVCTDQASVDDYNSAKTYAHVADVCFVLGAAAIGVAAYMLFTSPRSPAASGGSATAQVHVSPAVGQGSGGVTVGGSW
jgi:hypothetical protein